MIAGMKEQCEEVTHGFHNLKKEISEAVVNAPQLFKALARNIHIPYLPPVMGPNPWLLYYVMPPFDRKKLDTLISDFSAGLTIGLTLVPQGIAYSSLANLPPVNGLYAAVFQPAMYAIFGTSNCLAVGPVAIVSLLVASLVNKYGIKNGSDEAVALASQSCLGMGIILVFMGVLNLGSFICFLSHPVISGFTSAAAMLIGLSQVKSAFNFANVPQVGDSINGVEYQYEQMHWYIENWNAKYTYGKGANAVKINQVNPFAVALCFGVYVPLIIISQVKQNLKLTAEQKKTYAFAFWQFFTSMLPLMAIIIAGNVAYNIQKNNPTDPYALSLKIVGTIKPGLDIIKIPRSVLRSLSFVPDPASLSEPPF
jgi:MFS superfamily sulfate permease-like transporter